MPLPESGGAPVWMPFNLFRCLLEQLAGTRLFHPHRMPSTRTFSVTFTTSSLSTPAAYGSLKPAPTSRLRRTPLHLRYSTVPKHVLDTTPHRSVRARSRIRLLSWMRGGEANLRIRVQNSWERNPAFQQRKQPLPGLLTALATPTQNGSPQPAQSMPKNAKLTQVSGDSMVLVVALNNLLEPFTHLR